MSQPYYYQPGLQASMGNRSSLGHHPHNNNNNNNNNGNHRSRRSTKYNTTQTSRGQFKDMSRSTQAQKETLEALHVAALRKQFDAARSFDLEDDELYCPHLLTDDDLHSMHSAPSDRSSTSGSESPDLSPHQHQLQPTPSFALPAPSSHHVMANAFQPGQQFKVHAPQAQRSRNAIPIVDPNSRNASPPNSLSPSRQPQQKSFYPARRW